MLNNQFEQNPGPYDNYSPPPQPRGERNPRIHEDRYSRSDTKDQSRRSSSPPRQYASPHDRYKASRDRNGADNRDFSNSQDQNPTVERGHPKGYDNYRRGRSPSPRGQGRRGYLDRDREDYRSPPYGSRSRSRSLSRSPRRGRSPYYGGPPSREVILEGLPLDMVEDDIARELKQYHHVEKLDDIRVIRDRVTKVSRGFGFLRFSDLEKSKAFVERNYPMIYLYGNGSTDSDDQAAKVRIAFSRERDDRARGEKAEVYFCQLPWPDEVFPMSDAADKLVCSTRYLELLSYDIDMVALGLETASKPPEYLNSGDSDASTNGTPSQFLLLRGLEPTVTEDLLAKGVAKLYKPNQRSSPPAATGSKKSTAKIVSTTGDASLGAKEGSLRRVLLVRDRRSNESWRYGFAEFGTVDDAQAALTRFNSFEKFTISSKPVTADYIHAGVFVPVFNASESREKYTFSPLGNSATKLAYWDEEAWVSELIVSSATPQQTVTSNENQVRSASDRAAAAAEKEGLVKPGKETETKAKKRKVETSDTSKAKKTAPAHLQFWSNRHAELHGVKVNSPTEETKSDGILTTKTLTESKPQADSTPSRTYANLSRKCCYLCSRQFKTDAEVHKHERMSQLHRDNLKNDDLVKNAEAKMAKAGISTTPQDDTSEYRDRAKERRIAFGASKKTSLPLKKSSMSKDSGDAQESVDDDATPVPSKGAALLGKMGWSAGEGLGAQGTGMVAPIATDMYVQGVGLGAQGGKIGDAVDEADRNTKGGYGEFLERTKDKAKERFERMAR